jgi:hypothetical protein
MRITLGLLIGSQTAPATAPRWVLTTMQTLEISQGQGGKQGDWQQGFQMHLRAERGKNSRSDYQVLDSDLLKPGQRLIVTVTLGASPRVLFDGVIMDRRLTLDADGGSVYLMGKDLSALLDLAPPDVSHAGMGDKEMVSFILSKYAQYGITPRVSDPDSTWTPGPKQFEARQMITDRKYLLRLARRHSFLFLIRPGSAPGQNVAWWGREEETYAPLKSLTANAGPATNVENLNFQENALAPVHAFGSVESGQAGQLMKIDVQKSSDKSKLAKTSGLDAWPGLKRRQHVLYSGPFPKEAEARAQAVTDDSIEDVLVGRGTLDSFRYGDLLQAPGRVQVRGVGATYDGDYHVRQVTHKISRAEYKQEFVIAREGVGTTETTVRPS